MSTDDEIDEHLWQRDNGIWYFRDQRGGDDYRRSLQTRKKPEARKRAKPKLEERNAQLHGENRVHYHDAVLAWAAEWLPEAVEPSTAERYISSGNMVEPHLRYKLDDDGNIDREAFIDEIGKADITKLIRERRKSGVSNRTIQRDLTMLDSLMFFSTEQGWREDNPVAAIDRRLVKVARRRRRLPPEDEIEVYLARVPPMAGRLVTLLRQTGMRTEEAVLLTRPQIRWGDGVQLYKTKWGLARFVPFTDCPGAEGTLKGTPVKVGCDYVFWSGRGDHYKNLPAQLAFIRKELGFSWTNHDLRHLFAVEYLRRHKEDPRGWLYKLQQIMGHRSVKTTEEYLQYVEDTTFSKQAQSKSQV